MKYLEIVAISSQHGKARYPDKETAPKVAKWRHNLTALSQRQNLLFVAYLDKIHVFQPQFPKQTLEKDLALILELPKSGLNLQGYLCPTHGHAVNHLILGELGNEEILVVACDDGDVISYTVHAIDRALEPGTPTPRPWFLQNVGKSAWGLAIHTDSRLLAVSSNSMQIDVFAPALIDRGVLGPVVHFECLNAPVTHEWTQVSKFSRHDREISRRICLKAHSSNIPSIAFANTDLDREGRYLASTDIDNITFIWDLFKGKTIFKHDAESGPGERGWGVTCLDPRTSRLSNDSISTFGCEVSFRWRNPKIDISSSVSNDAMLYDDSVGLSGINSFEEVPVGVLSADIEHNPDVESNAEGLMLQDFGASDQAMEVEANVLDVVEQIIAFTNQGATQPSSDASPQASFEDSLGNTAQAPEQDSDSFSDYETDELLFDDPSEGTILTDGTNKNHHSTLGRPKDKSPKMILPFNLLQTSQCDVFLFSEISSDEDSFYKVVIRRKALHQNLPSSLDTLSQIERLNMIAQIPELGAVIIANQSGRVGILTTTRWEGPRKSAYRFECILPFKSQEEKNLRPRQPLMGIAVGPIQGHEIQPRPGSAQDISQDRENSTRRLLVSSRRYRILLVYRNHSILNYEISQASDGKVMIV